MKKPRMTVDARTGEAQPTRRKPPTVFNRTAPPKSQDWCSIENVAEGETSKTKVYIYDEIGFWGTTASDFARGLAAIDTPEIELHLNSPGGDMFDGIAIYNALVQHEAKVTVIVDALAASAASFIAQAGDEVLMAEGSTLMIHDALALCYGNEADMQYTADLLSKFSNTIAKIYSGTSGETPEAMRALMREELWMDADEAVEMGLATGTLTAENKDAQKATNQWDFSIFNHASRDKAPSMKALVQKVHNSTEETKHMEPDEKDEKETTAPEGTVAPVTPTPPPAETSTPEGDPAPVETVQPPATPVEQPQNRAFAGLVVNGVQVTDLSAVQAHITGLETFRNETKVAGRKAFIKALVDNNQLAATQVDKTEKFAMKLSDEDWGDWSAMYEDAPSNPLFGSHGPGGIGADSPKASAADDQTAIWRETVMSHKASGMGKDAIMGTESYKNLLAADPTFKL